MTLSIACLRKLRSQIKVHGDGLKSVAKVVGATSIEGFLDTILYVGDSSFLHEFPANTVR